jgi:hypothetical protein
MERDGPNMICMWLLCVRGTDDGLREEDSFLRMSMPRSVGWVRSGSTLDVRCGTGGVLLPARLAILNASSDLSRLNKLVKLEREWPFLPVMTRSDNTDTNRWWSSGAHGRGAWSCGVLEAVVVAVDDVVWWMGCQMAGSLGGVGGGGEA